MRVTLIFFTKKKCSGQMSQFEPQNGTSHNSGSALRIFFTFCTMKRADMYMEIMSIAFPNNSSSGQMSHSGPKMVHPHNSGSATMIVLYCTMRGAKREMEIIVMVFLEKILLGAIWSFRPTNGMPS